MSGISNSNVGVHSRGGSYPQITVLPTLSAGSRLSSYGTCRKVTVGEFPLYNSMNEEITESERIWINRWYIAKEINVTSP